MEVRLGGVGGVEDLPLAAVVAGTWALREDVVGRAVVWLPNSGRPTAQILAAGGDEVA